MKTTNRLLGQVWIWYLKVKSRARSIAMVALLIAVSLAWDLQVQSMSAIWEGLPTLAFSH